MDRLAGARSSGFGGSAAARLAGLVSLRRVRQESKEAAAWAAADGRRQLVVAAAAVAAGIRAVAARLSQRSDGREPPVTLLGGRLAAERGVCTKQGSVGAPGAL